MNPVCTGKVPVTSNPGVQAVGLKSTPTQLGALRVQVLLQESLLSQLASSHCSPMSILPSQHILTSISPVTYEYTLEIVSLLQYQVLELVIVAVFSNHSFILVSNASS